MTTKSPVSVCVIVRNDPHVEKALESIRPYVNEIVVVDTGSDDGLTVAAAKKYADIFEIYTDCNNPQTGLIESFAKARQKSFDLATQPWALWMDSDDIISGAEHLNTIIEEFNKQKDIPIYLQIPRLSGQENVKKIIEDFVNKLNRKTNSIIF